MQYAAAVLQLPQTRDGSDVEALVDLDCQPVCQSDHLTTDGARFRWVPNTSVAVVSLARESEDYLEFDIVIPSYVVLAHMRTTAIWTQDPPTPCQPVPWSDWGADAWVMERHTLSPPISLCGSRLATAHPTGNGNGLHRVVIYDFEDKHVLAREPEPDVADVRLDREYRRHRRGLEQDAASLDERMWVETTPARALFRVVWTNIKLRNVHTLSLAEDGIIVRPEWRWPANAPLFALTSFQTT